MKTSALCLKVVILGAPQVGKSALTVRFLTRRFIGEYSSGTDCTYQTMFQHEDTTLKVDIVDCSTHWDSSRPSVLDADAFIVVYSITDPSSLKHAYHILHTLHHYHHHHTTTTASKNLSVLLLGNKIDLQHLRQISRSDVTHLLTRHFPSCRHSEVSAAESCMAVDGPLHDLLTECAAEKAKKKEKKSGIGMEGEMEGEERRRRRRKSLLGHVSRRLGRVFRRKSLDELPPRRRQSASSSSSPSASASRVMAENLNRRSV